jgi:hypothetical protein
VQSKKYKKKKENRKESVKNEKEVVIPAQNRLRELAFFPLIPLSTGR